MYDFIGLYQWFSNCATLYAEGRVVENIAESLYTGYIKKHFKIVSSNNKITVATKLTKQ